MVTLKDIEFIKRQLCKRIISVPDGFYDSFIYTERSKKNKEKMKIDSYTHPFTIGILVDILWSRFNSNKYRVEVEPRIVEYLPKKTFKFNPDIIVYEDNKPIFVIDYESPNSSDCRVIKKDIQKFKEWIDKYEKLERCEYLIITTLPNKRSDNWRLMYTGTDGYNKYVVGDNRFPVKVRENIRENPMTFWYDKFKKEMNKKSYGNCSKNIRFINISEKKATLVDVIK